MNISNKRVLIVDDEEDLTWTLTKKLSKDSDKFELISVNSGMEAMDVLNQLPMDLVITDVRMPEVSGLDLLKRIRSRYPSTKVIIMTAYGSSDVQQEATERGCFHYIEKPFEINEMRQVILEALKEQVGFKGSVSDFHLGDIVQLNCLGRLTSALLVKNEDEEGTIYFHEGNIVHAEIDKLEGEDAFHYLMSWKTGEFSVMRNKTSEKETIVKGWQSLLLESMRRVDETSDLVREEKERKKRHRLREIKFLLEKVRKSDGVRHILLHTSSGFQIFYEGDFKETDDVTEMGNEISSLVEQLTTAAKFFKSQSLEFLEIHLNKMKLILHKIPGQDGFLSIVGDKKLNPGFLRMELKKILKDVANLV